MFRIVPCKNTVIYPLKETHLKHQLLKEEENQNSVRQTRRTHFTFQEIKWKLVSNEAGQHRGLATFILKNFEYRSVASVDSELHQKSNQNHNSHEFKVGDFELKNLLEDQKFKTILKPEDPISRSNSTTYSAFRVFCRVKPPVGGIPVKEHIELNMKPLTLQVTNKVLVTISVSMLLFFRNDFINFSQRKRTKIFRPKQSPSLLRKIRYI